jgi:hypothetical protein
VKYLFLRFHNHSSRMIAYSIRHMILQKGKQESMSPSRLLRSHREWESKPSKSSSAEIHLHGCIGDEVFGERTHDCLLHPFDQHCFIYIRFFVVFPRRRVLMFFFRRPFEGLHCVHLAASNLYGYIEHTHETSHVNDH